MPSMSRLKVWYDDLPTNPEEKRFADMSFTTIKHLHDERKAEKRIAKTHCTFCGKEKDDGPLKNCVRCRAACYCDRTCQVSDYQARHRDECANFVHPPTTDAFLTKPIPGERYPPQPVFAHGHEDEVGCWVTFSGYIGCNLRRLVDALDPSISLDNLKKRMRDLQTIRTHRAVAHSLLDLRVLVQNRRKDKMPVFVYGSRAHALTQPTMDSAVVRGTAKGDNLIYTEDGVRRVVMGVARDPWDEAPRVMISSVNGAEVKKDAPPSANIKDAKEATVLLNTGDYVILHLQFRVGDGDKMWKDWQALDALEAFYLPWMLWDGISTPAALATHAQGRVVRTPFDQREVREYFADFIERGQDAFTRSHCGDVYADLLRIADEGAERESEAIFAHIAQGEDVDEIVQSLRDIGLDEAADKLVRASRQ